MKIAVGCDHGGVNLKNAVLEEIGKNKDYEIEDFGTYNEESVDYIVYAEKVAKAVQSGEYDRGLLFCGTGIGMSLVANKFKGIRAACCSDEFSAEFTRRHNDSNILCLGGRVVDDEKGIKLVKLFLETEFEGGRHLRRVDMIRDIENKNFK
jgi:ribose 5-phosphate isomerase B